MSELINTCDDGSNLRWRLLTTVSALALTMYVSVSSDVRAADADRPTLWIELGGQFEQQTGQDSAFVPSFIANNPSAPAFQGFNLQTQKPPIFSNGVEGKITFEPEDTNWVFSAAILYGRANASKNIEQITPGHRLLNKTVYATYGAPTPSGYRSRHWHCCVSHYYTPSDRAFANMQTISRQSHAIVDFQVGRDVGLGLFGSGGSSVVSAGVRFVQFVSKSDTAIHALPDVEFQKRVHKTVGFTVTGYTELPQFQHHYAVTADAARNFRGFGPTVSWSGSAPLLGNSQMGEIALDWGANAAILFGRQRAVGDHQTYQIYRAFQTSIATHYTHQGNFNRQRAVAIPNVGGVAGVSFRYANAKVSFGYRGDFFFGAMDTGRDSRKTEMVGFYGPFATISIGIGG